MFPRINISYSYRLFAMKLVSRIVQNFNDKCSIYMQHATSINVRNYVPNEVFPRSLCALHVT